MNIKLFFAAFLSYISTTIYAAVPADLTFHNKPIDALCFSNIEAKAMSLPACGLAHDKYVIKGENANLINKGYIGYNWQDPQYSGPAEGYSYYKYFKSQGSMYWIYSINNGGGTGEFTAIHQARRVNANTLEVETVIGGDRCNGGVQDVTNTNGELRFSQHLTAYDVIALSKDPSPNIKAYDDLAACAVCCVAKAYYELKPNAPLHFSYVDLGSVSNINEMPEQGTLQSCFNQLLASYVTAGKTKLTQHMLDEFSEQFHQRCKKTGAP